MCGIIILMADKKSSAYYGRVQISNVEFLPTDLAACIEIMMMSVMEKAYLV